MSNIELQRDVITVPPNSVLVLRSMLLWVGLLSSTLIVAPLSVLTWPLSYRARFRFVHQWTRFNLWWLKLTCKLDFRVIGLEHIPARNAIVLAKHQSMFETLALQKLFYPQTWVLKRELLWVPLFGWGLAMLAPIAIDRKAGRKAVKQVIDQGKARLDAGLWVVIFPEGTRVAPGVKGRYGMGGALLAEHSGYPVVPVAHNAGWYWPRRGFLKYPGTIQIVIGVPIESAGKTAATINAEVEAWIESTVASIEPVISDCKP